MHAFPVRVVICTLGVLALPLVGTLLSDEIAWSVSDFVMAGALLGIIGTAFELALRRRGNFVIGCAIASLGLAAVWFGGVDDAPGLMLLGTLLAASGAAVVTRRTRHAH